MLERQWMSRFTCCVLVVVLSLSCRTELRSASLSGATSKPNGITHSTASVAVSSPSGVSQPSSAPATTRGSEPSPGRTAELQAPVAPLHRALAELRQTAPCHFSQEARKKAGRVGPNSDLALLCGICPEVVLSGLVERFSCDLAYGSDEVPVSIPPSMKSAWSFDVTFGSFTRAKAPQAVVISPTRKNYEGVRLFLMERRDGRWSTLNTLSLLETLHVVADTTLRDEGGLDVLIGTFFSAGDLSQQKVRAFRFSDAHVQRAVLASLSGCSERSPKGTLSNASRQNPFSAGIRVAGATVIIEGQACKSVDEASRIQLDKADIQWEALDWELGHPY